MHATKVVLITGTSSGIGKITAETLARRGQRVFAAMRATDGRNAAAAASLRNSGSRLPIEVLDIDVNEDASVSEGVERVLHIAGRIDVLINSAGFMSLGHAESCSVAQMKALFETNVFGPFRLLKAVLPGMRTRREGLIITISSVCGRLATPTAGIYSASKFAVDALAECVGYEVAPFHVDSVIVEPGLFATNLAAQMEPPADQAIEAEYARANPALGSMPARTAQMIESRGASTDPQLVADLLAKLIDQQPGTRPVRVTVGMDMGVSAFNEQGQALQHAFLQAVGLSAIERIPTA